MFDGGGQTCELKRKTPKWNHFIILHKFSSDCFVSCVSEERKRNRVKNEKLFPCNFNFSSLSFDEAARQVAGACRTAKGWARKFKLQISVVSQPILIKISFAPTEREFAAASKRKISTTICIIFQFSFFSYFPTMAKMLTHPSAERHKLLPNYYQVML